MLNLKEIEKEIEKFWHEERIVENVIRKKGKRGKFYFLDGPPYVTNPIHIGTAWNKIIKDAILRIKRMQGYTVWCKPGFDTHGLPIEVMVEKKLNVTRKKQIVEIIGLERFNEECKKVVKENLKILTKQFSSLGVWMEWDNPYVTYLDEYISSIWWGIKKIYEKNLLKKERRIFHWCPRCETVLSDHEVAQGYKNVKSPSIYVKFPIKGKKDEYILIWTTTPWTLPSNVAVMVHPEFTYVKLRLRKTGETLILLKSRIAEVIDEEYEVVEEAPGKQLEGLEYISPLSDFVPAQKEIRNGHLVVLSDKYVSEEEGTGCVHIAPEHGKEDFEVAQEYRLDHLILVDSTGRFTEKAGKYRGKFIFDADEEIVSDLERKGLLYKRESIIHKYPYCWRCKTPLFLRSTEQWVIKLSLVGNSLIKENRKIMWVPEWAGRQRFEDWIREARDWVISRQRFWGTPLPIWICDKCGNIVVIGSKRELEEKSGRKIKDLHVPFIDEVVWICECGGTYKRVPDVLDVWIDSGAASWASLGYPEKQDLFSQLWPVDFITEGHDQTRGWFYALLALGIAIFGHSPYRTVLMHGFTLDEHGRPMHKSLGNVIYPEEITEKYGIDCLRTFLLKNTIWKDLPVSFREIENTYREIEIILNVYQFYSLYASLDQFKYEEVKLLEKYQELLEEDKWILSKLEELSKEVNELVDEYHVHEYVRRIIRFLIDEVSRKYLKVIRRRVWIETADWEKEAAYLTLHYVLKKCALLMAPFAPYISEYVYQRCLKQFDKTCLKSIHLEDWPTTKEEFIKPEIEREFEILWKIVSEAISLRQQVGIKTRQPLKELLVSENLLKYLSARAKEILKRLANVVQLATASKELIEYEIKPKMEIIGPKWRKLARRIITEITEKKLARILAEEGKIVLNIEGKEVEVTTEDVEITRKARAPYLLGFVDNEFILLNVEVDEELKRLGVLNDLIRRIQEMRKEMDLEVTEYIRVGIETDEGIVKDAIRSKFEYFCEEVRATNVNFQLKEEYEYTKRWEFNGIKVRIGISRDQKK